MSKLFILDNNRGFTLIEAIISLGILTIGVIALFSTQTSSIRGNYSASRVTSMANWGSDEVEQVISEDFANIISKDPVNVSGDNKYTVSRAITDNSPVNNIKQVVVTVTNVKDGKQVVLQYYRANESAM
ncbi:MAG: prepilin-type N-terminal cleavage/methylation domain-containing protein [Desulfobulbaceae bacterium]|nr:prepilin-type N-terminal cleavage/methylation domain-containing protein [Desulfobulbaceae bacterium]